MARYNCAIYVLRGIKERRQIFSQSSTSSLLCSTSGSERRDPGNKAALSTITKQGGRSWEGKIRYLPLGPQVLYGRVSMSAWSADSKSRSGVLDDQDTFAWHSGLVTRDNQWLIPVSGLWWTSGWTGEKQTLIVIPPNSNTFSDWKKTRHVPWIKTH